MTVFARLPYCAPRGSSESPKHDSACELYPCVGGWMDGWVCEDNLQYLIFVKFKYVHKCDELIRTMVLKLFTVFLSKVMGILNFKNLNF